MAIYKMVGNKESLEEIPATSFTDENIMERGDLQRLLRDQPDVLEEGLFIVSEEFSQWQESGRSIDLLGLDSEGRLMVIELKRTETGDHAELQAIRYAAMVANLTFDQIVDSHRHYLYKRGIQ
jgi:RecB family endonuclease NucS